MSLDSIWNLLDNVFCVSHFSTMMKNSSDFYIDSTTYYPSKNSTSFQADDMMIDDQRMARKLADRERSRYLRHARPMKILKAAKQKAWKTHMLEVVSKQWACTLLLLLNGIILAAVLSERYNDLLLESSATKSWLKETSVFPTKQRPVSTEMFGIRNETDSVLYKVRTKHDWVKWFSEVICTEDSQFPTNEVERFDKPSVLLLRDHERMIHNNGMKSPNDDLHFLLVGNSRLTLKFCQTTCYHEFLPRNVKKMVNYSNFMSNGQPAAAGIHEVRAFLADESQISNPTRFIEIDESSHSVEFVSEGLTRGKEVVMELLKKGEVFSATFEAVLYNPSSNLYSHILSSAEMMNGEEMSTSTAFITNSVRSIVFSFSPNHYSKGNYDVFFISQVLLLCWMAFYVLRCILLLSRWMTKRIGDYHIKMKYNEKSHGAPGIVFLFLDLLIFAICFAFFVISLKRQSIIDDVIPELYGYDASAGNKGTNFPFQDLVTNTTQLSSVCGLLNFFLIMKLLMILKKFHNFPRFGHLSNNRKKAMGQIILLFLIFWTLVIILSFCSYLAFMGEYTFSSFLKSLVAVVLQCVTLGTAPVKIRSKFSMIRAKYGTLVTLFFFLIIFVTFRLLLKAFFVAIFHKKRLKTENKHEVCKPRAGSVISIKELLMHIWGSLQYSGYCLLSVLPCWNNESFANHYPQFTSLGFKGSSLSRRERIKLGYTSSENDRKPSPVHIAEETKSREYSDGKNKYSIPSEVFLSEIETQLDELYQRASTLADLANEDDIVNDKDMDQSQCDTADLSCTISTAINEQNCSDVSPTNKWQSRSKQTEPVVHGGDSVDREFNATAQTETKCNQKEQGKSRSTSSVSIKRKSSSHFRDKTDSGISCGSRNSTPGFSNFDKKSCILEEKTDSFHQPRGNDALKKLFAAKPARLQSPVRNSRNALIPERRYGWISDDDILDRSSDVSAISLSSFEGCSTPVPPLTTHNLAKHNHNILSRQVSSATRSAKSSERIVQITEMVSKSSDGLCENTPELTETFTQKLWKRISSIKNYFQAEQHPEVRQTKARPLRRSRTTAINVRDIPKVNTKHRKSSNVREERHPRAKSNASTTKLRSLMNSTRQALDPNHVQTLDFNQDSDAKISSSNQQENLHYHRNVAFEGRNELETFCIPGAVPTYQICRSSMSTTTTYKEPEVHGACRGKSRPHLRSPGLISDGFIEEEC